MDSDRQQDQESVGRIMVVDDDDAVRRSLERGLRRLGYDVVMVESGAEALKQALLDPPEVIVIDLRMPDMDGHTLIRRLGASGLDTAIVVTSAFGTVDDLIALLRAGVVDYLKKPWNPNEMAGVIGRAVDIHRSRKQVRREPPPPGAAAPPAVAGPAAPPAPKNPFSSIVEQIRRGDINVPSVAAVVAELRRLIQHPNVTIDQVVSLIERDGALAAKLLRISNSAVYSHLGRIHDLRTAVGRVGFRQVQSLVETISAHNCYQIRDPHLRSLQVQVTRQSLAKAVAMRALADLVSVSAHVEPETAYLVGLLGDTGASFLLWVISERIAGAAGGVSDPQAVIDAVTAHHEELGALILQRWDMDPTVVQVAQGHHRESAPSASAEYWSLSVLASVLAPRLSGGEDVTGRRPPPKPLVDRCASELQIGFSLIDRVVGPLKQEFADLAEVLG